MEAYRIPPKWGYNLGPLSRVPLGGAKIFLVAAQLVAVFRARNGQIFATQATWPHRKGSLEDGTVAGTQLTCPLRGFKFDLASGRPLGSRCAALETYPLQVSDRGEIKIYVEER